MLPRAIENKNLYRRTGLQITLKEKQRNPSYSVRHRMLKSEAKIIYNSVYAEILVQVKVSVMKLHSSLSLLFVL